MFFRLSVLAFPLLLPACSGGAQERLAYRLTVDRANGTLTFKCVESSGGQCILRLSGGKGPRETVLAPGASAILSGPRAGAHYCVTDRTDGDCPQATLRAGRQLVRRETRTD